MDEDGDYYDDLVEDPDKELNPKDYPNYSKDINEIFYETFPSCLICNSHQDSDTRLFRWPRNDKVRSKWCTFFKLIPSEVSSNYDHCFICSRHFDPDNFLYSNDKIFWASTAFPSYRIRNSLSTNSYYRQVDVSKSQLETRKRKILPPPTFENVEFRQSKFRIEGKAKHHVAIVRFPDNPDSFYEFSYNRTSPIDGSIFYSCLQCRKAKLKSKVNDCIRTIHLNGNRILSRGHPLLGHHRHCCPISQINRERREKTGQNLKLLRLQNVIPNNEMEKKVEMDINEPPNLKESEIAPQCGSNVTLSYEIEGQRFEKSTYSMEMQNAPTKMTEIGQNKSLVFARRKANNYRLKIIRPREFAQKSRPKCYICKLLLSGPLELVEHLLLHIDNQ